MKYFFPISIIIILFIIFLSNMFFSQQQANQADDQFAEFENLQKDQDTNSVKYLDDDQLSAYDDWLGNTKEVGKENSFEAIDEFKSYDDEEEGGEGNSYEAIEEVKPYIVKHRAVDENVFSPIGFWKILGRERFNASKGVFEPYPDLKNQDYGKGKIVHIGKEQLYSNAPCFMNYSIYSNFQVRQINIARLRKSRRVPDYIRTLASGLYFRMRTPIIQSISFIDQKLPYNYYDIYIVNANLLVIYKQGDIYFLGRDTLISPDADPDAVVKWDTRGRRTMISGMGSVKLFIKIDNPKDYPGLRMVIAPPHRGENTIVVAVLREKKDQIWLEKKFVANRINYSATSLIPYEDIENNIIFVDLDTYDNRDMPWSIDFSFVTNFTQ